MNLAKIEALYLRHARKVVPAILTVTALLWLLIDANFAMSVFGGLIVADIAMVIFISVRSYRRGE